MKLSNLHWGILSLPLMVLAGTSALAGVLVYFSLQWSGANAAQLQRDNAALNAIRQKVAQVVQEKLLIERYRDAYEKLRRGGAIGPEQRVNWLDALRAANQAVQTLGVDYQLSQQAVSPLKIDSGGYKLLQTTMKVDIKLLQEEDLQNFLRELDAQQAGLYLLQSCTLSRSATSAFSVRFEPKLGAQCELAWLSLVDAAPENAGR
jgi:hypothetical protein